MIRDSASLPDLIHTPEIESHAVEEGDAGHNSESPGGGEGDGVAEVEEGGGDTAEDDGEFELWGLG